MNQEYNHKRSCHSSSTDNPNLRMIHLLILNTRKTFRNPWILRLGQCSTLLEADRPRLRTEQMIRKHRPETTPTHHLPKPPQPVPVPRQRSGTYPPPTKRPSNTGGGSRKDPSMLRHLGFQQRPKRNTNPPQRITYAKNFKQTTTTHQSKDTSSEEES